ncbi:MAG: 7-dehydrocholesterol reductase [Gammaproteobacteria bacterium RIFCSPHIGHO2_12_FULL_42_13]|nr:MAG: 7-dehydrocholesterol reductase [Gammaproteobacteria bacterium RIFCSPHIGHO2_12_FULL_42_13]
MKSFFRKTFVPLFLMLACPPAAILFFYINTQLNGSVTLFYTMVTQQGFLPLCWKIWEPIFFGTPIAWGIILSFMAFQLALMRWVPGGTITGPETPKGNTPVYTDNGFRCFIITLGVFYFCTGVFHLFSAAFIYDHFLEIIGALNIFSLVFCALLYLKGRLNPSSSDHSTSGNMIFDYYWGTELYPRVFGWDIKQFTNCRFGMMSWPIIILSFAAKQNELFGLSSAMLISVCIMLVYIAKFFYWESGYLRSIDIMHDRAGFYICWGCLVWVPAIYTSPVAYLVNHPHHFSPIIAALIVGLGVLAVMLNYVADAQRQKVRATQGNCLIFGRTPKLIHATYTDINGAQKQSILLASGFWGISRHFHYLLEIALAFFWTLPALFSHFLPWFYVIFLTLLLTHRAYRDEARCAAKYGLFWQAYCNQVPNKIIPWMKLKIGYRLTSNTVDTLS